MRARNNLDYRAIQNPMANGPPLTEKQQIVIKLRSQNEILRTELKLLSSKLEDFILKQRDKKLNQIKNQAIGGLGSNPLAIPTKLLMTNGIYGSDPLIQGKERDLKES